jgi:hypothetical protein
MSKVDCRREECCQQKLCGVLDKVGVLSVNTQQLRLRPSTESLDISLTSVESMYRKTGDDRITTQLGGFRNVFKNWKFEVATPEGLPLTFPSRMPLPIPATTAGAFRFEFRGVKPHPQPRPRIPCLG